VPKRDIPNAIMQNDTTDFIANNELKDNFHISLEVGAGKDGARPAHFQNFCVVLYIVCFVSFCVLFVCKCVLDYCHRVTT
jgi:hypothetical protein